MYKKNYQEVSGIVSKDDQGKGSLDFEKLTELVNGHTKFLEKVHECFEQNWDKSWLYNIKIFSWKTNRTLTGSELPWVGIAFRMPISVDYFACCPDGAESTFVVEAHYNQDFISQMAEVL